MKYERLAMAVFNKPLMITQAELESVVSALNNRMIGGELRDVSEREREYAGYEVVKGVAIINVIGGLVHRGSWMSSLCGMTGYDFLANALDTALEDDSVDRIAFRCDSGGGQASGAFDFSDKIFESRGTKPMTAIVADAAYSAAYLIASAADEIVVTRTAGVGSVGVVMAHVDQSKANEQDGIEVTYIHSGSHKVDANPHEPLSASAKGRLQAECDGLYQLFIDTVARNRGMSVQAVRDTQALTYTGQKGIDIGFADRISPEGKELSRLFGMQTGASSRQSPVLMETTKMSENQNVSSELTADELKSKLDAAKSEGIELGASNERARISTILETHADKPVAANRVALHTDMSVESAASFMAGMPAEGQVLNAGLDSLLEGTNPELSDDIGEVDEITQMANSIINAGA